jgi:hypothetical protein
MNFKAAKVILLSGFMQKTVKNQIITKNSYISKLIINRDV